MEERGQFGADRVGLLLQVDDANRGRRSRGQRRSPESGYFHPYIDHDLAAQRRHEHGATGVSGRLRSSAFRFIR